MDNVWLQFVLDIFKLTIPGLVIFLAVYYTIKNFLDNDYRKKTLELRKTDNKDVVIIKMQAYERLILYLERINPASLLVRLTTTGMSAAQLKADLIASINEEFNHNIAQQLYVSPQSWKFIKVVKEQLISLVNAAYHELEPGAKGVDLSKKILDTLMANDTIPTDKAIDFLKKEFKLIFD